MVNRKKNTRVKNTINDSMANAKDQDVVCDDVFGKHNSQNHDAQIENNSQVNDGDTVQSTNFEDKENESANQDVAAASLAKHKIRGPTKAKNLPSDYCSRMVVDFDEDGQPIGDGSVKLSSYLGVLVREHVPVTLDSWKNISEELKVVLWDSVQARFKLDEEFQKKMVFQHMGVLFRSAKSRLVGEIQEAKNEEERLRLKPDNINSITEWKKFLKLKTSTDFKEKSEKFRNIRSKQLPHTTGRRGMARLTEDLKSKSHDPKSISRAQVWIKAHTRKNGEPVNTIVAENIEKITQIERESKSGTVTNYKSDALTQVLGAERPGRLRGMGRGMNSSKAIWSSIKDKRTMHLENTVGELEKTVRMLVKNRLEQ